MKTIIKKRPRLYNVGIDNKIIIKDYGKIKLSTNEQISFIGNSGLYDFCRKNWGFYSTPSINKRLKNNNFETYLVKNIYDNIYLWTVEKNKKKLFHKYLVEEYHDIIIRLDNLIDEKHLINLLNKTLLMISNKCDGVDKCKSKKKNLKLIYSYKTKPKNEPDYKVKNYTRSVIQCNNCLHFFANHKINTNHLYKKNYSLISHGENLYSKFNKIIKLKEKSDNFHRVERILNFFNKIKKKKINFLDIGSGLGIFLYSLRKKINWNLTGIEPDLNFYNFSKNKLNLNIKNIDFNKNNLKKKYNIITLNKVIEHVKSPDLFLHKTKKLLKRNGFIYIEVPDGVAAHKSRQGKNREEFFLDHLHIFSIKSLKNVLVKNKFKVIKIENIKERSGKYTIYAFAKAE